MKPKVENEGGHGEFMATLHLTKIDEDGNLHFLQGFSDMLGIIYNQSIKYYYLRFDWLSREKIDERL